MTIPADPKKLENHNEALVALVKNVVECLLDGDPEIYKQIKMAAKDALGECDSDSLEDKISDVVDSAIGRCVSDIEDKVIDIGRNVDDHEDRIDNLEKGFNKLETVKDNSDDITDLEGRIAYLETRMAQYDAVIKSFLDLVKKTDS